VTCQCVLTCDQPCDGVGDTDEKKYLCNACYLDWDLAGPCGLMQRPTVWPKLDPEVVISDARKDAAIDDIVGAAI
jgi:hypothetical protein